MHSITRAANVEDVPAQRSPVLWCDNTSIGGNHNVVAGGDPVGDGYAAKKSSSGTIIDKPTSFKGL